MYIIMKDDLEFYVDIFLIIYIKLYYVYGGKNKFYDY